MKRFQGEPQVSRRATSFFGGLRARTAMPCSVLGGAGSGNSCSRIIHSPFMAKDSWPAASPSARPRARTPAHPHLRASIAMPYAVWLPAGPSLQRFAAFGPPPGPKLQCLTMVCNRLAPPCNALQRFGLLGKNCNAWQRLWGARGRLEIIFSFG